MYYIVVNNTENLVVVVAIVVSCETVKELLTTARKHPMLAMQEKTENFASYAYLVKVPVVLFVPSFNLLDAYPVSIEIYDYFAFHEAVVDLLNKEADKIIARETIVAIDYLYHSLVLVAGCN